METEHPFITGMRTNLNTFNAQSEERTKRIRRNKRNRIIGRIIVAIISAIVGLGIGAAITSTDADATTQAAINQFIRVNGGIPPCVNEDGSAQPGKCFWDAPHRGNGEGRSFVAVPTMPGHDKRIVYLSRN